MKNTEKKLVAFITTITLAATTTVAFAAANITAKYDKETDNGKVVLNGVETTGTSQSILVLSEDVNTVSVDEIVYLYQMDDGTAFNAFYLPRGTYANLDEGSSATYYVRIGGADGTIQRTELTISKEVTTTPTPEPTEEPTEEPAPEGTPTAEPTAMPTAEPTTEPTGVPTSAPTEEPTTSPTEVPTTEPTAQPTSVPTEAATTVPTTVPTTEPTAGPTEMPTAGPTETPTPAVPDIKCRIEVNAEEAEATAHILNTYDEGKSVVIAVAQYDSEGNLISIKSEEIVVPHNTESPKVYTVKSDQIAADMDHVRCFIWDGFKTMKPISELKE